jgi:predicted ATP-dependent endonuclease of OLD family
VTHIISEVEIKNYKSCKETVLKLSSFTPFIGYNNAGKSNCLSAIQWLLRKSSLVDGDFNDKSEPVEVIAVIEGISQEIIDQMPDRQRRSIAPYVNSEKLKIKRTQLLPNAKAADIKLSVWNEAEEEWAVNPTGIDNAVSVLLPEPIRIGAMENAAEDASKAKTSTTIGKLLSQFIEPVKLAHEEELNQHLVEVRKRISSDGDMRFEELDSIDSRVNSKVDNLFPGMSIKLHFETPSFEDIIKGGTIKVYEDDQCGRDFASYGHGAQRSIQMALVQYLAEIKRTNNEQLTNTLLLIDEPELYLHPFAIEQVREALLQLSESGYQVLISTHSAQMVTPEYAENALLIRKSPENGTYTRERLSDAIQRVVPNSIHQMEQLFSLSHSTQVLFSENVVLTEGKTELRLLPYIFKKISDKTMGQEKHALIAQSGVNDTKKSLHILEAMDLPAKAIADLDYGLNGAIAHGFIDRNDPDILGIKSILIRLSQEEKVTLNGNSLPKNGIVTAAEAFEILANEADAQPLIESLHNKMKLENIWLWKRGAIEAHIGTNSKDEQSWAAFKRNVDENGLQQVCPDFDSLQELVEWLRT